MLHRLRCPRNYFYPRPPRGGRLCHSGCPPDGSYFYPRPPRGGRPSCAARTGNIQAISIHALREEGDCLVIVGGFGVFQFLSTPSARRATSARSTRVYFAPSFLSTPSARRATASPCRARTTQKHFYPRPPRGGRLCIVRSSVHTLRNFYPRPPRGGRQEIPYSQYTVKEFLSTPSARRATGLRLPPCGCRHYFYPRPPRGGRLQLVLDFAGIVDISIHALREEGDLRIEKSCSPTGISIHALREEGDARTLRTLPLTTYFYPRPPRGGRPAPIRYWFALTRISIHALREEGDGNKVKLENGNLIFLSTPSARRATS